MLSRMDTSPPQSARRPSLRTILAAVVFGVLLGGLLAVGWTAWGPGSSKPAAAWQILVLDEASRGGPGLPFVVEVAMLEEGYPLLFRLDA